VRQEIFLAIGDMEKYYAGFFKEDRPPVYASSMRASRDGASLDLAIRVFTSHIRPAA
jgi:hypothetical protein